MTRKYYRQQSELVVRQWLNHAFCRETFLEAAGYLQ